MAGLTPDEHDASAFQVDWPALKAGRNPWKRAHKIAVDPFLVAKAVKEVMRQCPNRTATGGPLVWNDYAVFLDIADWTRIKKLESTLVRDLGGVVEKELATLKAEMVGPLNVRLLRDESGNVRPGTGVIKADFAEAARLAAPDPAEMTVRVGKPVTRSLTDLPTERVPEMVADGSRLSVNWEKGSTTVTGGTRVVLGRPHQPASPGFVPLTGAASKINKRHLWIEAGGGGVIIGRFSQANPVEVAGRLVQQGGQIAVDHFPVQVTLSNGEMQLTIDRT
ncbi:MAG TPA: FhaA domain-containing protein [Vicinamibacteria bacterium]|nr:FhaA domain-containing protein [Vicinamibacteria bacterium]